eukprot:453582-Pyramimonas_sp.AAC.1
MELIQNLDRNNDNYSTPPEVWENIKHFLPVGDDYIVWEPFFNSDSKSPCHLSKLGCNVLYSNVDFFNSRPSCATHIVSNPPFSCREKVLSWSPASLMLPRPTSGALRVTSGRK